LNVDFERRFLVIDLLIVFIVVLLFCRVMVLFELWLPMMGLDVGFKGVNE
jgi:high-affinity Fe2+/Pb2+ permease